MEAIRRAGRALEARDAEAGLAVIRDQDAARAREVASEDDAIDHLYHATFDEVVELMGRDPADVERGTRIIIASHDLERIGDRATNIAEDVVDLVTGQIEDPNPWRGPTGRDLAARPASSTAAPARGGQ